MKIETLKKIAKNNWELTKSYPTTVIQMVNLEEAIADKDTDIENFDSFYDDVEYEDNEESTDTWRLYDVEKRETLVESYDLDDIEDYVENH